MVLLNKGIGMELEFILDLHRRALEELKVIKTFKYSRIFV